MTIAVCLITCDRTDYTDRTLRAFLTHNDTTPFTLLHGDDASADKDNVTLAQAAGFETVFQSSERVGGHATRRAVVQAACERGAEYILMLENDWEWVHPFPWPLYRYAFAQSGVDCLRLYGQFKERGTRPCDARDAGTGITVDWQPLDDAPEPAEIGQIHWAAPPSVARADMVQRVLQDTDKPGQARRLSSVLFRRTVRPVENVVYHIGASRTPEFVA